MRSIRRFMVIVLVAIVTLANFAAAVRGYLASMDEAEQLFNQRLLQQVDFLNYALGPLAAQVSTSNPIEFPNSLQGQVPALTFQWLTRDGELLARSAAMPAEPLVALEAGFYYVNFNSYRWHLLVAPSADNHSWYILAERDDQRYRLAESMILPSVLPMLLALPLLALIIWWVAGVGLRPVKNLAAELHQREATDLRPIAVQSMPVELLALTHSANELLRRLEASFTREKRFSGDAAHELRTPLAALQIHCENLLHELQPVPVSALKVQQGISRMSYLVEQVLLLNRTAPDHFMGQFEPVNLTRLARQAVADCSEQLALKQHQLELHGEDAWVLGDRAALTTMLNNLLGNAIKYTPEHGSIALSVWRRGQDVVIEVMDSGPGIPADQRGRVFDRFYRLGGDRHNSQTPGCGLGLSIVRQVVDLHAAEISLSEARFAHGLLVTVIFAACAAPATATDSSLTQQSV